MAALGIDGIIISADSHVMEPVDLWKKGVPEKYREAAPLFPPHKLGEGFQYFPTPMEMLVYQNA